jgi:hypothetical protein
MLLLLFMLQYRRGGYLMLDWVFEAATHETGSGSEDINSSHLKVCYGCWLIQTD